MQMLEKTIYANTDMWVCTAEAERVLLAHTQKLLRNHKMDKAVFNVSIVVKREFRDDPGISVMCITRAGTPIDASLITKMRAKFQKKYPDIDFNIY